MLEQTLARLGDVLACCRDPWCIVGGTALWLHGYREAPIADVDVLVSLADGERLITEGGLKNEADGGTARFHSPILLHPDLGGLPVEIFAGFKIFARSEWQPIRMPERLEARIGEVTTFIAGMDAIAEIFELSGRPKDLARLRFIKDLPGR